MWINYTDGEVAIFHPVCQEALKKALAKLNITHQYEIKHHELTGSLEMDFVVKNKNTGKYLCIIEVKRTPMDVQSARYQFQAQSYVQMSIPIVEKPFYIITNLEFIYAFRYDANRPRVVQQMLKPGLITVGRFTDYERENFIDLLSETFKKLLEQFINDKYEYIFTLEQFTDYMMSIKSNRRDWRSSLVILLYEYIRGAFISVGRKELKDIRRYSNDIKAICNEAIEVNFEGIFQYDDSICYAHYTVDSKMMAELFELGKQNIMADMIADVIHSIACEGKLHEGKVSTDIELARVVCMLTKYIYGKNAITGCICDPAAGSGSLLRAAIEIFPLKPNQIIANDIDTYLIELLTVRLGLSFVKIIHKGNSPKIFCRDIVELEKTFFNDVDIIILNPPYMAGINCVKEKRRFAERIAQLSGQKAMLDIGQIGLEGLFLELVYELCKPETIISCIMPKQYLVARGPEATAFRKFLIQKFGLELIFYYPRQGLFQTVTKDTCVFIGRKLSSSKNVKIVSSYESVSDIDLQKLFDSLNTTSLSLNSFVPVISGVEAMEISKTDLLEQVEDGWRQTFSELNESIEFVNDIYQANSSLVRLNTLGYELKRGHIGTNGISELLFIDSNKQFYEKIKNKISKTYPAIKNAKVNDFLIDKGDAVFFNVNKVISPIMLNDILKRYCDNIANTGKKQVKKRKSINELLNILKSEVKYITKKNSILIPRDIRRYGKVYITTTNMYVSTNFIILKTFTERDAIIIASWMSTIMYQLLCEVSSKDQEGARKMEKNDVSLTLVPNPSLITNEQYTEIYHLHRNIEFVDLYNPQIRKVDELWASFLFDDNADYVLKQTQKYLKYLVNRRDPRDN